MKKTLIFALMMICLLVQHIGKAQGVVYLSNLNAALGGTMGVASNLEVAEQFWTGANAGGYALDSVQISIYGSYGNPGGFTVALYTEGRSGPTDKIGLLSGNADPFGAGTYTYTADGTVLLPNTYYWIVCAAATSIPMNYFGWSVASDNSYTASDHWGLGGGAYFDGNSSQWVSLSFRGEVDELQLSISATPVPEPAVGWLGLVAGGIWGGMQVGRKLLHRPVAGNQTKRRG